MIFSALLFLLAAAVPGVAPFSIIGPNNNRCPKRTSFHRLSAAEAPASEGSSSQSQVKVDDKTAEGEQQQRRTKLDSFLEKKYPSFYRLLMTNDETAKAIKQQQQQEQEGGVTVFVPNEDAFKALGKEKISQIEDPRNLEIRERIASYHVVQSRRPSISAVQLVTEDWSRGKQEDGSPPNTMIAGINTLGGNVPIGRSKSGGFLGWGAKEDGDIVIGSDAKIVFSYNVEGTFVHEVSALISPSLLWRYCDQLRIL